MNIEHHLETLELNIFPILSVNKLGTSQGKHLAQSRVDSLKF